MGLILLFIVIVIFVFPFTSEAGDFIEEGGDYSSCSLSLIKGNAERCRTYNVEILKDEVKVNNDEFIEKGAQSTEIMAKDAMARLLVRCMGSGGGYNSRAFSSENWVAEESVCLECFKINIDDEVGNIGGLTEYLRDTPSKGKPGKKYLEVLTRDSQHLRAYMEFGSGFGLAPSKSSFIFIPNKEYTVFFIGLKEGYIPRNIPPLIWDDLTTSFMNYMFGIQDTYFVYLAESSKIPKVCDRPVN